MWSVKTVPNLGAAIASARAAAGTGASLRRISKVDVTGEEVVLMCGGLSPGSDADVTGEDGRGAGSVGDACREIGAHLGRRPYSGRSGATVHEVRGDGSLDLGSGRGQAEVVEQQGDRQHGCRRVGLALAGDVRGRAVHGLEHARC